MADHHTDPACVTELRALRALALAAQRRARSGGKPDAAARHALWAEAYRVAANLAAMAHKEGQR